MTRLERLERALRLTIARNCAANFERCMKTGLYGLATRYSQVGTWALTGRWLKV